MKKRLGEMIDAELFVVLCHFLNLKVYSDSVSILVVDVGRLGAADGGAYLDERDGDAIHHEGGNHLQHANNQEYECWDQGKGTCHDEEDDRVATDLTLFVGFFIGVALEINGGKIIMKRAFFFHWDYYIFIVLELSFTIVSS